MRASGRALWSRWVLVAVVLVLAASLFATVWVTKRGVDDASDALIRGQAATLQADLREEFRERGGEVGKHALAEVFEAYSEQGLRYIAFINKGRATMEVGQRARSDGEIRESIQRARRGQPIFDGEVVGMLLRARGGRAARRRGPPPIYLEFVPKEAQALRAASRRSLAIGSTAALLLLLVAIAMGRLFLRQDRMRHREEEDRRLKALGQMSAVLAHEIRNPLASLKGNAQLLESMVAKEAEPSSKLVSKSQRVVSEAVRLENLVSDLLNFARSGELRREDSDPGQLLQKSADLVAAGAIELDLSQAPKSFRLDPARVQQVLCNLLRNAVETRSPVQASASSRGSALVYRVRDHGPGIDESQTAILFEPFHTKKTQGTGLGLALAKRIVELHGGRISASNAEGGGAEFVVELPST